MREIWKQIGDFPRYEINNRGEIANIFTGKTMKNRTNGHGILMVDLTKDDGQYTRSVKTLVAREFVDGRNDIFNTAIQRDGNRENCDATNLVWRPRWFAIEYAKQFRDVHPKVKEYGPIVDEQHLKYQTLQDAAIVNGALMMDIYMGLFTGQPIFPDWHTFSLM